MQPVIPSQSERRGLSAHGFLSLVQQHFHTLQFFDREREYIITDASTTAEDRLAYLSLKRGSAIEETLLFMLESHEKTREYYTEFEEADFTQPDRWRLLLNRGISSQGKLTEFTRKRGLPYSTIRAAITVTQKEWIIENELGMPGLSINFFSVRKRLAEMSLMEIELFCQLIRESPLLPKFRDYSWIGLHLRQDYTFLMTIPS